jgi:GDPmannose 4,6-dehydratase
MTRKALILGVTGQDGSYLADLLLGKGYAVHGMVRRSATGNTRNIRHLLDDPSILDRRFFVERGDLADPTSLYRIIREVKPDEIYNEADQDHVRWSFDMVGYSSDVTGAAVGRLLEIVRQVDPGIRVFQPCSSNMFGRCREPVQNEETPFAPQSVYAIGKVTAYYLARYYREAFGLHASTAILYNHESPRRSIEYVTRKITSGAARIALGKQKTIALGDVSARVDWGYAKEYMEAAWRMLQRDEPGDYVIATGEAHSVQEFAAEAFRIAGLDWRDHVTADAALLRPTNTSALVGDAGKAKAAFGFEPKIRFKELVRLMVEADLEAERKGGD